MAKDPAFLFYPGDWLGGTIYLTRAQKGAYFDLLMAQFNSGPLSLEKIKVVLGSDWSVWPAIQDKFTVNDEGLFFNERLAAEKLNRQNYVESRSKNRAKKENISYDNTYEGSYVLSYEKHMENENKNINESKIINGASIKKSKSKKSKFEILTENQVELKNELSELINIFNQEQSTNFRDLDGMLTNYEFWRAKFTPAEIETAIRKIKYDQFWNNKITPTILFRKTTPSGDQNDKIEHLINLRENNATQNSAIGKNQIAANYLEKIMNEN
jgi:uncharacterized protein YdaU (DUF1376 family)